jgi:hypothetical protein
MTSRIAMLAATLGFLTGSAETPDAASLVVVTVAAPAINCVFNQSCKVTVSEGIGTIPVPGITGTARMESRTLAGGAGTPTEGKTIYMYRVDLTQATGKSGTPCVGALVLDFGPIPSFDYDKDATPDDVFVITVGGLGTIPLAWADRTGNMITFAFGRPVCPGASAGAGETSFFFGLASAKAQRTINAQVMLTNGQFVATPARAPIQ